MTTQIHAHLTAKFGHFLGQDYLDSLNPGPSPTTQIATQALTTQSVATPAPIVTASLQEPTTPAAEKTDAVAKKKFSAIAYEKDQITPDLILAELCKQPYQFFQDYSKLFENEPEINTNLSQFNVCTCPLVEASMRISLEDRALDLIQQFHPKDSTFTIVSVGAGGCYQELVYIAKLNQKGYKRIHLIAIDKDIMPIRALLHFCKTYLPPSNLRITDFPSVVKYLEQASRLEQPLKPNLLLLLDISHYEVNRMSFLKYAFTSLHKEKLIESNTVIAYSEHQIRSGYCDTLAKCGLDIEGDPKLAQLAISSDNMKHGSNGLRL